MLVLDEADRLLEMGFAEEVGAREGMRGSCGMRALTALGPCLPGWLAAAGLGWAGLAVLAGWLAGLQRRRALNIYPVSVGALTRRGVKAPTLTG